MRHVRQRCILEKSQQDDLPMLFRQTTDTGAQAGGGFVAGRVFRRRRFRRRNSFLPCHNIVALKNRQPGQRHRSGTRAAPPFLVAVQQYGVEPGRKPAALIVVRQTFPGLDECFGNEIFRGAEIARKRGGLSQQARLQWLRQKAKRLRIPGARAFERFSGVNYFDPVIRNVHLCINPRRSRKGSKSCNLFHNLNPNLNRNLFSRRIRIKITIMIKS